MDFPRVLIYGQPFNNRHGGGITLTNLFKGWPKNKIAVADTGHMMYDITTEVCDKYYQMGSDEYKWLFPFNLIQKKYPSGLKSINSEKAKSSKKAKSNLRYAVVNNVFYPFLQWFGVFHFIIRIKMSTQFRNWLSEFKPDLLYLQVTTRESVLFVSGLIDYLKVPAVIHFMDDWPSTIAGNGLFRHYWGRKIDKELKCLLNKVDLHLSISDAMSAEYKERYSKNFIAFHNPIDTGFWLPHTKEDFSVEKENVKILCSGRIGQNGVSESLIEVATAIDKMNEDGFRIKFHIQTSTKEKAILERLGKHGCVVFNKFADYSQLPVIFSNVDLLLIANDFNSMSQLYLKYSMPTKASEYMISGTPVMVYSSEVTAVSKFFREFECGYCVSIQGEEEIMKALQFFIDNKEYRERISKKAVQVALDKFDASRVREQFQSLLVNLTAKNQVYKKV